MIRKKAVDLVGIDSTSREYSEGVSKEFKASARGVVGDPLQEPVPEFISTPSEKVISNKNNSWIVLGRDRVGSRLSGYGGQGDTHAASIDIVAGRLGYDAKKVDSKGNQLYVDPSFKKDAARIYISQKTDVDKAFGLPEGRVGNAKAKSAVAIKADGVRLIAREGIKLVTKTDKKNSQGGDVRQIYGIDLIAGNLEKELQPLVKGGNLQEAMERLVHHIGALTGIVDAFLHTQMQYNEAIATHWHSSPFFALPTTPSEVLVPEGQRVVINQLVRVKRSLVNHKMNLAGFKLTYLNPAGKKYINSRFNSTN